MGWRPGGGPGRELPAQRAAHSRRAKKSGPRGTGSRHGPGLGKAKGPGANRRHSAGDTRVHGRARTVSRKLRLSVGVCTAPPACCRDRPRRSGRGWGHGRQAKTQGGREGGQRARCEQAGAPGRWRDRPSTAHAPVPAPDPREPCAASAGTSRTRAVQLRACLAPGQPTPPVRLAICRRRVAAPPTPRSPPPPLTHLAAGPRAHSRAELPAPRGSPAQGSPPPPRPRRCLPRRRRRPHAPAPAARAALLHLLAAP